MGKLAKFLQLTCLTGLLAVSGCGAVVPPLLLGEEEAAPAYLVNSIVGHVKCELRSAIRSAIDYDIKDAQLNFDGRRRISWLDSWAVKVSLKMKVNENSVLAPGATLKKPLRGDTRVFSDGSTLDVGQTFSLGLGGAYSSEATRTETINFAFLVSQDLVNDKVKFKNRPSDCKGYDGLYVDGDLGIKEWIHMSTFSYSMPQFINMAPPDAITHQVSFEVSTSGNINPTWNLVNISANSGSSPLFSASRNSLNEVTITLGPADGKFQGPSQEVNDENYLARLESAYSRSRN